MKKLLLYSTFLFYGINQLTAQCIATAQFGASAAPTTVGQVVTNSTCNYYGEFSPISGFQTQYIYSLAIAPSGYVTVVPAAGGAAVAFGPSPLAFTPPANGNYVVHWHQNAACGTDNTCHATTVTNTGFSAPCVNPAVGGTANSSVPMACPNQGFGLTLTGATGGSGLTYQWQSSADGITFADIAGATSASYTATQTAATYYQCLVTCSAGTPAASTSVFVGQNTFMGCYCASQTTSLIDEEIYNVTVNGASTNPLYANAAGCTTAAPGPGSLLSQYSSFTTLTPLTQIAPGQTVSYSFVIDECDGAPYYNNGVAFWIDYNQNGLFTDAGELIFAETTTSAASALGPKIVSGSFTVPTAALTGNTVMRVICREGASGAAITPCGTYGFGETEDHLIAIQCPDLTGVQVNEVGVCAGQTVTITGTTSFSAASITWWDAPVGGTQIGSGPSYTTGVLSADTNIYVQEDFPLCASSVRDTVPVQLVQVSVDLLPVAVTCNNGNNGTLAISGINCGTPPFQFAANGGAFGPTPTNLTVGTHEIVVRDATLNESVVIVINVGDALAPSDLVLNAFDNDIADISWNGNGSETQWNVEWGAPGFIPGTGAAFGTGTATDTNYVITGLVGNVDYDIYVSANCGAGTTAGDWIMITMTTLCDPFVAQSFCESFDSDSPTQACWTVLNLNTDTDFWNMDYTFNPFMGNQCASILTNFNAGANDDWLISPGMILTNNEIMSFNYRSQTAADPNDFQVLLSTTGTDPLDFTDTLMYLNSYANIAYQDTSIDLSAFSGVCYIAFHIPQGGIDGNRLYIDQFCVDICTPDPGTDGNVDVCRLDQTVDLNSVIVQGENNGIWSFPPNQSALNDSLLTFAALAVGTYDASYIVTTACVVDTTTASITVYNGSSAGTDGVLTVCKNQPFNLLSGLSGIIDLGGTWYGPTGQPLPSSQIIAGALPGQFNYQYVVSNGVCPNDTANIVLNILGSCDALGAEYFEFEGITMYPNPTSGVFTISNLNSQSHYSYEITDLNGRIVDEKQNVDGSVSQDINIAKFENGVYILRIFNDSGEFLNRIVKQ